MKLFWKLAGDWTRHRNPDGSLGGEVSRSAHVSPTAYIPVGALVAAGANVADGTRMSPGDIVLADGSSIRIDRESDASI
jgi:hypothetical protein